MLIFVGLGVEQSPSLRTIKLLGECNQIFYENYTSPVLDEKDLEELSKSLSGKKIETVTREFVEDGRKLLELARDGQVGLVSSGDPMSATTHQELRIRAIGAGIRTRIVHGSSVITAVAGELGLHSYNLGRIVTLTREPMQYTAYDTIYENLLRGLHTTILLEWDEAHSFFLSPNSALSSLIDVEKDLNYGIITKDTLLLCASRIGTEDSKVLAQSLGTSQAYDFGNPPHVLVIPGKLHFTEREALSAITGENFESFQDNSSKIERKAERMLSKYSKKTLTALQGAKYALAEAKGKKHINYSAVFENVECYTQDALRFLNEGKEELAILSIGYAEGLLDSLRFSGLLEFEW